MKKSTCLLTLLLTALFCLPWTSNAYAGEITVADGTETNNYVPVFGYYSDTQGNKSQMLYLASDLASLANAEITGLTFYYASGATSWGAATFDVKLAEVDNTTLPKNAIAADFTTVYSGALSVTGEFMTISFTTNFTYSGDKNLLIEVSLKTASSYTDAQQVYFYGETVSGASNNSKCSYSSPAVVNFRPKATFVYTPAAPTTCPKPTDLAYSNLTSSSVDLAWNEEGTASNWNVLYKATGDADWTTVGVTANPYTLALQPSKHYEVKVQADCGGGDESKFSNVVSFDTPCGVYSLPYNEDFGGNINCWTKVSCADGSVLSNGTFMFAYNPDPPQYLISPELKTTENQVKVEFEYKARGSWTESFNVGYSTTTSETSAFTWDEGTTYNSTTFASYSKLFPAGVKYIAIQYTADDQYGLYIDNLSISEYVVPTCFAPTALEANAVTANSATLTWTAGQSGDDAWVVEYSTKSDFSSDVNSLNATAASKELTELEAQTTYYARVKTNCGTNGESDYCEAVSFTTACSAKTAPWSEDFEDETANAVPACWNNAGSTATTSTTYGAPTEAIWAVYNYSSNKSIRMCNAYANTGVAQVTSPVITLPVSPAYEFKFDYAHTATCGNFKVQISTDGGASFTDLGEYGPTVASPSEYNGGTIPETFETDKVISLAAYSGNIVLRFVANANYEGGAIFIDNIAIREAPSCFKPTLNEASAITPDGATFCWTASDNGETQYQYTCVPTGETPNWDAATKTSALTATVSGKAAGTYDFYVRSWCSESDQSEAVSKSFTTATVPAPTGVTVTGITNNSASASWTAPDVTYPVQYQWKTSKTGSVWSTPSSDRSAALSGLEANTEYTIYVRTYYSAGVQSAEATKTFTTACDPVTISTDAYVEHFETFPACWDNSEGTTLNANYKWSSVSGGQSGKCVRFEGTENNKDKTNVLASPLFELNADADLTFYWKNAKTGEYKVQIAVGGGAREDLVTGLVNNNAWTKAEVALTDYKNLTIQLFFCGTSISDGNANLWLDELAITPLACRKPATLNEATAITSEGATLTWTAGGADEYQYAVAEAGTAESALEWHNISALTVTLNGLQPSTSYDFYVRTYCDAENQSEARKVSFKTDCGTYSLPFEQNFNSVTAYTIPECWNNEEGTLTEDYQRWRTDGYSIKFNSSTNDAGATNVLATPYIQLGNEKYLLTFRAKNPTGGAFKVQIEGEGIAREDLLVEGLTGLADWTLKYVEIPAKFADKKVQLFFHATSNEGDANAYISVDDVRVARGEVFADSDNNESRLATLASAGETMDVIFNRTLLYNGDYNTLCLPFSLSAAQLANSPLSTFNIKAYDYATIENEELLISIAGAGSIEAGVPYFVANRNNETNKSVQLYQDVVITASTPGKKDNSDVIFKGVFNPVDLDAQTESDSHNELFLAAGNMIYWPAQDKTVKGFRAYFKVKTGGALKIRKGMPARIVEQANTATGINDIHGDHVQSTKMLENGQVIIIRNGVKYSVTGQKIQ